MELVEYHLMLWAAGLKLLLELVSLICIVLGLLNTLWIVVKPNRRSHGSPKSLGQIRLNFGRWLSLALEFQLGADVVNTTVAPTTDTLLRLGIIALIRTFLNYFLTKELEQKTATAESNQLS